MMCMLHHIVDGTKSSSEVASSVDLPLKSDDTPVSEEKPAHSLTGTSE